MAAFVSQGLSNLTPFRKQIIASATQGFTHSTHTNTAGDAHNTVVAGRKVKISQGGASVLSNSPDVPVLPVPPLQATGVTS